MATFYTGATGVGSGPHLDFRIYDVGAGDYINPTAFTDVLTVGGKPLTDQYRMTSGYGPRNLDIPGASKFHKGLDYATPTNTPVEVKGGRFLTTFKGPKGGIMSQYAFQKDGKDYEVLLLHGSDKNPILSGSAITNYKKELDPSTPVQIAPAVNSEGLPNPDAPGSDALMSKDAAPDYGSMTKQQLNDAYDALRTEDMGKARVEGMKMHKAFFNK